MKKVKSVFRYIFAIVLAISLIIFFLVNILSSTILDKKYVSNKLDETGYYDKVYGYAISNFENYIIQSGLDKSVLDGIITREDVVNDTQKILNNIYSNIEETVNAESLKTKLHANIENATQGMIVTEEQKVSLNGFVDEVAKEYLNTIAHFDYEKEIFNACHKFSFILDVTNKLVLIFAGVSIFGLMVTCGKKIYKIFASIGFSMFVTGLFFIIMNIFVNAKVNIQTITILNDALSFVIRDILGAIFEQIVGKGLLLFFGGVALIFVSNLVHNFIKYNDYNEKSDSSMKKTKSRKNITNLKKEKSQKH